MNNEERVYFLDKLNSINNEDYNKSIPYPHLSIENILENKFAIKCQEEILNIPPVMWDRYNNPFEQKYTLRDKNIVPENCQKLFDLLTSKEVIDILSYICGEKLYNDPTKNWWGIHTYENGDYLDIHSDAGIHPVTKQKKHITLGIYLSKDWSEYNGGYLEIWDGDRVLNDNAKLHTLHNRIFPSFNKMIMFTNTTNAWHGNPDPIIVKDNEKRIFLTLSYLSEKYTEGMENNRLKAFFIKRPNDPDDTEKDNLRILRADPEACKYLYNRK